MRRIILNGHPHETKAEDIAGLVAELGQSANLLLIEWNTKALRKEEWGQPLVEGDKVEILRISAGG